MNAILKSCQYCGRIHDSKYDCGKKPKRLKKKSTKAYKFRSTIEWQDKRQEIKERDNFVCQICIRNLYEPERQYETDNLSVHHAIPIENDWEKRLDDDNLITSCDRHHEMMEDGRIPYQVVQKIISEQEEKRKR